jgi:4-hydroxy-tetrahydrodipicolinate synthase
MLPETVARLAAVPNIIGIKEATGDLQRLHQIRGLCGAPFAVYSGDDATGCEMMLQGGDGVISVTANVAPRLMHEMCQAALSGDREKAQSLDHKLAGLHSALFIESNPIPVKWAVAQMGFAPKGIRLPLTWLSDAVQPKVKAAMQQAGIG